MGILYRWLKGYQESPSHRLGFFFGEIQDCKIDQRFLIPDKIDHHFLMPGTLDRLRMIFKLDNIHS